MKKIDTSFDSPTLGRPFLSRSLDHIQQAYTEITDSVVKGILGTYTANDVIVLYGCVLTGTDPGARTVTAGAIYYNGEIYLVDAGGLTTTLSDIPLWTIVTTYQSGDPILFTDNVTFHNVSQIRKFVLVAGPAGGSGVTGYVADYNATSIKHFKGEWTYATAQNSWSNATIAGLGKARYKIGITGEVVLDGFILANGGSPSSEVIFTLPSGYRPTNTKSFIVSGFDGTTTKAYLVKIETSGAVSFLNTDFTVPTFGTTASISLIGIRFYLDN